MTTRWSVVSVALLAGIIAAGYVGKLPPALPPIRAELHLDLVTAGWLASLFSATGVVFGIVLGAVADRLDHRRLIIGGLALMAVSGACGALSTSAAQLIVTRFFEGVGFLAVVIAAPAMIAHTAAGRERRMALGLWPGYMPAGVSLMILAAPLAMRVDGWRALWLAVALLAVAGAVAMWLVGQPADASSKIGDTPVWQNIRSGASRPGPWLVGGCFALYGAQLYAVITWLPTFLIGERTIGATAASALTAVIVIANGLANVLGGWLLHRGATPWAMITAAGVGMALAGFGMFSVLLPDIARYLCSVLLCGLGGLVASAVFAAAPAFAPSPAQLGVVNGILVQASNVAQFAGPAVLAAVVTKFERWESALWAVVGVNLLLIVLALMVHRQEQQLA